MDSHGRGLYFERGFCRVQLPSLFSPFSYFAWAFLSSSSGNMCHLSCDVTQMSSAACVSRVFLRVADLMTARIFLSRGPSSME